jgi:hypothetical protein
MRAITIPEMKRAQKHVTGNWTVRAILDGQLLAAETFDMKP